MQLQIQVHGQGQHAAGPASRQARDENFEKSLGGYSAADRAPLCRVVCVKAFRELLEVNGSESLMSYPWDWIARGR